MVGRAMGDYDYNERREAGRKRSSQDAAQVRPRTSSYQSRAYSASSISVPRRSIYDEPASKKSIGWLPAALAVAAVVIVAAIVIAAMPQVGLLGGSQSSESDNSSVVDDRPRVSFVAVGDNLPNDRIGYYADAQAGDLYDDEYDYTPIFAQIKPYIQAADIAYINQETHCGGSYIGPRGYPSFNTTDEMADAVVDTGFDFVASATNHSYDWGYYGALEHSVEVWEDQPVAFTGTAVTEEQYERIAVIECDGITFALLNYTYGVNSFDEEDLPDYAVNFMDEDKITADVERAKEVADVVLVAMHWGTENLLEADDQQLHYAQLLADLDVDVVLGSHPHCIGPLEWVENSDGSGHRTLVAYSLGNFVADHDYPGPANSLEGMLSCDFVRDGDQIIIENIVWTPLVFHTDDERSMFAVYALKDYPEDLARENNAYLNVDDPIQWMKDTTVEVIGDEFTIDM